MECSRSEGDNVVGIPWSLFITMSCVATFGTIYSVAFIVFNIIYRNDRYNDTIQFCTIRYIYVRSKADEMASII